MKSRKSASGSKPHPRLSRTLKRETDYHPIEQNDIRWVWAAYKKGALGLEQYFPEDMTPDQFTSAFEEFVLSNAHACFVIEATTEKGLKPIGLAFGRFPLADDRIIIVGSMTWFPWSTKRSVTEGVVGFINDLREKFLVLGFAEYKDKKFFEHIAKHGIIRRVGTLYGLEEGPMAEFQSISRQ